MKSTPIATTLRSRSMAAARSGGSPQTPAPVMRIAPNPRRLTVRSPPRVMVPAAAGPAFVVIPFSCDSQLSSRADFATISPDLDAGKDAPVELRTPYLLFLGDAPDQL